MQKHEKKIMSFIDKHQLFQSGDRVVVGVSGGPDSLFLLDFLYRYQYLLAIHVLAVHVDHMFRGEESAEDLRHVVRFCTEREIECYTKSIPVSEKMRSERLSLQDAARKYRYAFYKEVMIKTESNVIALGHHGDDQVETILMKLTRGTTLGGKAGIAPIREFGIGQIVRPLLCLSKTDIEHLVIRYGLEPRYDPSNEKLDYTRNRFRHHILPFLKKENKNVHLHMQRYSEETLEDEAFLQQLAKVELLKIGIQKQGEYWIRVREFQTKPLPLQRRVIHLILNYLYKGDRPVISTVHIDETIRLLNQTSPSGSIDFPHQLRLQRSYDQAFFRFDPDEPSSYQIPLSIGDTIVTPNGCQFTLCKRLQPKSGEHVLRIDLKEVKLPLIIRTRVEGDRIRLKGMSGSKKIKSIFMEHKIPRWERDGWPLVTDETGKMLWVPELKRSLDEPSEHSEADMYYLYYKKQPSSRRQSP